MNTDTLLTALEIIVIVALVLWRQMATRRFRPDRVTGPLIMLGAGLMMTVRYSQAHVPSAVQVAAVLVGLAFSVAMAWPRAYSYRLTRGTDGGLLRTGTWATLGWWILVFAVRMLLVSVIPQLLGTPGGNAAQFGSVTILLSLGATFTAQHVVLCHRARAMGLLPARVAAVA